MESAYLHVEVDTAQSVKGRNSVCGDIVDIQRSRANTTIIICDGMGSGVRANLAARMAVARMTELLTNGFSLWNAFARLIHTINEYRGKGNTYAAFTVVSVLPSGAGTVLTYDAPTPIIISKHRRARPMQLRFETIEHALVGEATCVLEPGEGILAMTDGITQAGLGRNMPEGWPEKEVAEFINVTLADGQAMNKIPEAVHKQALQFWASARGDDCTASLISCRPGKSVTIFTGPPSNKALDPAVVNKFMRSRGTRVVCGGTTAGLVARCLGKKLNVNQENASPVAPPAYSIDGIDLVTEGVVTLNQVANLIEIDPAELEEDSGVSRLCRLLHEADRVIFIVGRAINPAGENVTFRQIGVLRRERIVELLAEDLRKAGKMVLVERT